MGDTAVATPDTDEEGSERLVPLPLLVSPAQKAFFTRLARERQMKVGTVVREAIREWLAGRAA